MTVGRFRRIPSLAGLDNAAARTADSAPPDRGERVTNTRFGRLTGWRSTI